MSRIKGKKNMKGRRRKDKKLCLFLNSLNVQLLIDDDDGYDDDDDREWGENKKEIV